MSNGYEPLLDTSLAFKVTAAIRKVVGSEPVALHEPVFEGREWEYVRDCLESTFVSSIGPYVDRFESELANFTGAKYAVVVVNGTAGLHTALMAAGVRSNDEVLIPALTFVATANAVKYCGATPHLVDVSEYTLGMDPEILGDWLKSATEMRSGVCVNKSTGGVIRAVVPMHTFGHPCELDALLRVASEYKLVLVEDAAESLGSYYSGRHTGTFGQMGVLSFNGNKTITTGGGGAILTDDPQIAKYVKHLTTTAKVPHRWEYKHDQVGYNYRMPNLNAALGCAQLEQLPEFIASKRKLFERYQGHFNDIAGVELFREPERCRSNYWLQAVLLDKDVSHELETILASTNDANVMTRPVWNLISDLEPFKNCPKSSLTVSQSLAKRLFNIPSSANI